MPATQPAPPDSTFQWMLRLVGLVLAGGSAVLLVKNIGFGMTDDVLLGCCLVLGAVTFAAGWLPERERAAPIAA